jgi:hypothetical protein
MRRELRFKPIANEQLAQLENDPALKGVLKQVRKTLGYLETNLQAKSLQTYEYVSLTKRYGRKVFEAYAQQKTPGAYRILWHHGPSRGQITILVIMPQPEG